MLITPNCFIVGIPPSIFALPTIECASGGAFVMTDVGNLHDMARLSINRCIKEIGVRIVLGATVSQILTLHTTHFLRLVIIAFEIAIPLAWFTADYRLQSFAYRIELSFWLSVLAGVVSMPIGAIIVSFQAIKAASLNPATSLRTE